MNIQIASDLHLDQLTSFNNKDLIIPCADILVLAGDICHIVNIDLYEDFFNYLNENFQYIVYIPGNHEFYNKNSLNIDILNETAVKFLKKYKNFIYLNNQSVLVEDVLFTGSCLWCNPTVNPPPWFHIDIKKEDVCTMYNNSIKYLEKVSNLNYEKHVIITHYPPISFKKNIKNKYSDYYNNKDIKLNFEPKYWIFGHTHQNFIKTINNTTYISNQRKDKQYKKAFHISF